MVTKAGKSSLNGDLVNLCSLLCQQEALPFIPAWLLPLLYRVIRKVYAISQYAEGGLNKTLRPKDGTCKGERV